MVDRPILFSAPMVKALLDGRKTQTRRVLKPQPFVDAQGNFCAADLKGKLWNWGQYVDGSPCVRNYIKDRVRFARGDRLWVREAWRAQEEFDDLSPAAIGEEFAAEHGEPWCPVFFDADQRCDGSSVEMWQQSPPGRLRASMHMPRWASRLTLIVTDVRVERLQAISEADAIAEGATARPNCSGFADRGDGWCMDWSRVGQPSKWAGDGKTLHERDLCLVTARHAFANFIDVINGSGTWDANPWIVAVTFTVEKRNIDTLQVAA